MLRDGLTAVDLGPHLGPLPRPGSISGGDAREVGRLASPLLSHPPAIGRRRSARHVLSAGRHGSSRPAPKVGSRLSSVLRRVACSRRL